jgi:hypothetical protein
LPPTRNLSLRQPPGALGYDERDRQFVLVKRIFEMREQLHQQLGFVNQVLKAGFGTTFSEFEDL